MAVLRFRTARLDVTRERPNPINPIPGESLLLWLRERLGPENEASQPEPEDWGWCMAASFGGRSYLVGASAEGPEADGLWDWTLQLERRRTLRERLLGLRGGAAEDPCLAAILALLRREPGFGALSVEP